MRETGRRIRRSLGASAFMLILVSIILAIIGFMEIVAVERGELAERWVFFSWSLAAISMAWGLRMLVCGSWPLLDHG